MEPSSLDTPIIAMPLLPVIDQDGEGKDRRVLAVISKGLGEPFNLYESANAWWTDIGKVERLMEAFKNDMTIEQACNIVQITRDQYYYFLKIHPEFSGIKGILGTTFGAIAKVTLGKELQKDGHLALAYLKGAEPESYARRVFPGLPGPAGTGSYARKTEEVLTDSEGRVMVSRSTAELLRSYDGGAE